MLDFHVIHELLNVLNRVKVLCFVLLARRAVHEMVLLTGQVLDDSFNLRGYTSLRTVKLEMLDVPGKLA